MSSQGTTEHSHNLKFWSCKNLAHQSELSLSCFLPKLRWMTEGEVSRKSGISPGSKVGWWTLIIIRWVVPEIRPILSETSGLLDSFWYLENQHPNIQLQPSAPLSATGAKTRRIPRVGHSRTGGRFFCLAGPIILCWTTSILRLTEIKDQLLTPQLTLF